MPKSSRDASKAVISALIIDMMRTAVEVFLHKECMSNNAHEVLLCCAMFIGQAEGRPMTAAKIAGFVGIPRPSTIRKLHSLKARGIVEQVSAGKWRIAAGTPEIDARITASNRAQRDNIRRATAKLSKLDTVAVARQK